MSDDIDAAIRDATCPTHPVTAADRAIWAAATRAALEEALRAVEAVHVTRKENGQLGYNAVMDCAAAIRAIADGCAE